MGAQHEILNHEGLVAFEARAGRDGPGLDDALLMNGQIGALGALAPAFARRTLLGQGLAGLLHAARLDLGPAFEPLETGDLVPLGRDGALQLGALDHERNHQRLEIRKRPRVQISGQSHARNQSEITPAGNPIRPDFRPSYGLRPFGLGWLRNLNPDITRLIGFDPDIETAILASESVSAFGESLLGAH